jgi:hypothetical protein
MVILKLQMLYPQSNSMHNALHRRLFEPWDSEHGEVGDSCLDEDSDWFFIP